MQFEKPASIDHIFIANWKDFTPGEKALNYGEPVEFSYAAFFDVNEEDFDNCRLFKIIITDYLGHEYKKIINAISLMQFAKVIFLIQD